MKLIIATGIYPPDIGGPATYSKKIAEEFSGKGWEVKIITYCDRIPPLNPPLIKGGSEQPPPCEGLPALRVPPLKLKATRGRQSLWRRTTELEGGKQGGGVRVFRISRKHNVLMRYVLYTWKLIKLAKKADLIYAQGPVSEGLPTYLASKITGKKYVLKVVGDPAWERLTSKKQENPERKQASNGAGKKTKKQTTRKKESEDVLEKQMGCHSPKGTMTPSTLKNLGISKFVDVDEFQNMKGLPFKARVLRWVERLVAKNAYKIIVPSEYLKKIVGQWGVNSAKVKVVYNSVAGATRGFDASLDEVDPRRTDSDHADLAGTGADGTRKEGGEGADGEEGECEVDIILSAGRLVPWKGMDLLIDLMPELLAVNPNFKLVIAGDGLDYQNLKQIADSRQQTADSKKKKKLRNKEIEKLGHANEKQNAEYKYSDNDKIVLTGKLEHRELLQYMKKASMFILNSGYEGLPHTVIEAMQSGLPCAVSNIGGNPEIVENEKTGLLFEYNNKEQIKEAIVRLWQDTELRNVVVAGARKKVKEFSYERMVEETIQILNFK